MALDNLGQTMNRAVRLPIRAGSALYDFIPGSAKREARSQAVKTPSRLLNKFLRSARWVPEFFIIVPATVIIYSLLNGGGRDENGNFSLLDLFFGNTVPGFIIGFNIWILSILMGGLI